MKNLIIIFVALVALSSCNSDASKKQTNLGFENVSWESEKNKDYQLITPIEFSKGACDIYGFPVRSGNWYIVSYKNFWSLLPVKVDIDPTGPDIIELYTVWKKIATIDTIQPSLLKRGSPDIWNLGQVDKIALVCFKDYAVYPTYTNTGQISIKLTKK